MKKSGFSLLCFLTFNTFAQNISGHINTRNGVAIQGYDPVAYIIAGKPIQGKEQFHISSDGAIYWFSTQNNKSLFLQNPDKYKPQYGGWCAYAMGAKGTKVEIDPKTFKISGGKLFLFYNKAFTNTLPLWNKDEGNLKNKADVNWDAIISNTH